MAIAGVWLPGVLRSWKGRTAVAVMIGVAALASGAVPAAAAGRPTEPAAAPKVIATVPIGSNPAAMAVSPVTGEVYIVNDYSYSYSDNQEDRVAVINPRTNKITAFIPIKGNSRYGGDVAVAISAATGDVYVTGAYLAGRSQQWVNGGETVISGRTNKIIAAIPFHDPTGGVVNPITGDFYLSNNKSNDSTTVAVFRGAKVIATIPLPGQQKVAAVSPVTGDVYVSGGDKTTVISGRTNKIIAAFQSDGAPMAVSPVTDEVYYAASSACPSYNCSDGLPGTVTVTSGQTNKVIASMTYDPVPDETAFSPVTGDAYVGGEPSATIGVLDGRTNQLTDSITFPGVCPGGPGIQQFAISPRTGDLYVPLPAGNPCAHDTVWVLSTKTNKATASVALPTVVTLITVSPTTGEVYVLRPQVGEGGTGPFVASVISG